jgi:hypothetical protein
MRFGSVLLAKALTNEFKCVSLNPVSKKEGCFILCSGLVKYSFIFIGEGGIRRLLIWWVFIGIKVEI